MKMPAFLGSSYVSQSPTALNERTINWYPERLDLPGGKSRVQLYPTPGVTSFATSVDAPTRGGFYQNGRCFFALGARLKEVDRLGLVTDRGALSMSTANPVTMTANGDAGDQLVATSGNILYLLNLNTNVLTTPTIDGVATQGAYLDGYFLYLDATTSTLYKSALFDGATWDPTDFARRSAAPDPWKAVAVNKSNKSILLLGEESGECWYNTGNGVYPFAPIPGALFHHGIAAPFSITQVGNALIWLSRTSHGQGDVVFMDGLVPRVISTPALRVALASYETLADAVGDARTAFGHTFYRLTFPTADATWVYDLTTGQWFEEGTWIVEENRYVASRTLHHVFAFDGRTLAGDRVTGTIWDVNSNSGVDVDNRPIRRLRRGPSLCHENTRLFYARFQLFLEAGLGVASGQGSDPMVMLRCSNDGGKTWGNELMRSAGARGQYGKRVIWERLGSGRDRQFEITVSDPIPWRLTDAFVEVEAGAEVMA